MPPPVLEDDFDGLDEVIDEMSKAPSAGPARSTTASSTSTSTAEQVSRTEGTLDDSLQQTTEDFPDPDDSALDEELAKELEEQMQGFLKGLDGAEADTLAKLMQDFLPPADRTNGAQSNASGPSTSSAQPKDFKSSVASTLEKMRQSERSADQSLSTGDDPAAMLSSLLGGLGDLPDGDEASLQAMLDQMMSQLMSKDLLYEPLKEMRDKYPAYLEEHKTSLSKEEYERYGKQRVVVDKIVVLFENDKMDEQERNTQVSELVKEMNDYGAPPKELMGDMPEGLELGADGMPKMMNDCPVS